MYLSVEGLIGAGKSTVLRHLSSMIKTVDEPLHLYRRFERHNPLLQSYKNLKCDGPIAQLHILRTACEHYNKALSILHPFTVSDRCSESSLVFIETYRALGIFSDFTADYLTDFLNTLLVGTVRPDTFVFLDTPPQLCQQRIEDRSRSEETGGRCTVEFQTALRVQYLKFFERANQEGRNVVYLEVTKETPPAYAAFRITTLSNKTGL